MIDLAKELVTSRAKFEEGLPVQLTADRRLALGGYERGFADCAVLVHGVIREMNAKMAVARKVDNRLRD